VKLRKSVITALTTFTVLAIFAQVCFAFLLLTEDKGVAQMFPEGGDIKKIEHTLTDAEIAAVKGRLGGKFVHFQVGSKSADVVAQSAYTFYVGSKDVAIIEEQPGKWGPVKFIIAIDATGKVTNLAVMEYKEKRGRPIARRNFLSQFVGKGSADPISVKSGKGIKRDIRSVSGATISSDCTCFAVKKAIALYEEVYKKM